MSEAKWWLVWRTDAVGNVVYWRCADRIEASHVAAASVAEYARNGIAVKVEVEQGREPETGWTEYSETPWNWED